MNNIEKTYKKKSNDEGTIGPFNSAGKHKY